MFIYLSIMDRIGKALGYVYPKRRYAYGQPTQIDNLQANTSNVKVTGHMWKECEIAATRRPSTSSQSCELGNLYTDSLYEAINSTWRL